MSQTRGTVAACACPWCRKANDFRGLEEYGLERGCILTCDHCDKHFSVVDIRPVTVLRLARANAPLTKPLER